jgi:hypothetical protein
MAEQSVTIFCVGFACGIALLAITAYRHVSPVWLRVLLMATGLLMMGRYAVLAEFAGALSGRQWFLWWSCGYIAMAFAAVFAVDQLLRHPAMTPRKLMLGFLPFLLAYMGFILLDHDLLVKVAQGFFSVLFVGGCGFFIRKIPVLPIRIALGLLALAFGLLGMSALMPGGMGWSFEVPEIFTLFCLWYAFETALALQRPG